MLLRTWFLAFYFMSHAKNGISALELMRHLGVGYRTGWLLHHKIMKAMALRDDVYVLCGKVQIDDAYLGGKLNGGKAGRGLSMLSLPAWPLIWSLPPRPRIVSSPAVPVRRLSRSVPVMSEPVVSVAMTGWSTENSGSGPRGLDIHECSLGGRGLAGCDPCHMAHQDFEGGYLAGHRNISQCVKLYCKA